MGNHGTDRGMVYGKLWCERPSTGEGVRICLHVAADSLLGVGLVAGIPVLWWNKQRILVVDNSGCKYIWDFVGHYAR